MTSIFFCQCQQSDCRLRYPVADGQRGAAACPRCGGAVVVAEQTAATIEAEASPLTQPQASVRFSALLDNIRSVYNVGSLLRTADGAGLDHLYLGGITATPDHPKIAKTALGAQSSLGWSHRRNGPETAVALQAQGHALWALETGADADSLFAVRRLPERPLTLVVGNEVAGVDPAILARCERRLALPMVGVKGSLNVAVAFGIAIYHLRFGLE